MAVKSSKAGSIQALRASAERKGGSGNDQFLQRIPADDSLNVRFLTEPDEWQSYFEHYDQVLRYYPCSDDCPGCTEGDKPTQKYLANVYDIDNDRLVPLVLPKTLAIKLLNSYDKYKGTLRDRDYELIRTGSGLDTDYDRAPEAPGVRKIKADLLDLQEVLENQLRRAFDEGDQDQPPPPARKKTAVVAKKGPSRKPVAVEPQYSDEDEEEVTWATRDELEAMSLRELRMYATAEAGIPKLDIRGLDQEDVIKLILDRLDGAAAEEVADDEDDEDEAEEDTEAESEEDVETLDEDQIRAMKLEELRDVCAQLDIAFKRTEGRATLIKRVLESSEKVGDDDSSNDDQPPF